jgi:hypothetical protein
MNMFEKASTKTVQDLTQDEIRQAQFNLNRKIKQYNPKIVAFNGKSIYETYIGSNVKNDFNFGKQSYFFDNNNTRIIMFVLPSSSARCSQLPKVVDKVPFYVALKQLREHLNGRLPILTDLDVMFPDFKVALNTGAQNQNKLELGSDDDGSGGDPDGLIDPEEASLDPSSNNVNGHNKKNEHKIKFVRLNNLPYSRLPSNILENINEQRKSKKGVTITTNTNMFNSFGSKSSSSNSAKKIKTSSKSKTSSLSSDMETGSNLTFDDSLSIDHNFPNNNQNNQNNQNNHDHNERISNIGSIVLNLVSNNKYQQNVQNVPNGNANNHNNVTHNVKTNQPRQNFNGKAANSNNKKVSIFHSFMPLNIFF